VVGTAAVIAVHKQMHQRTEQERKKDERAEQMGEMLHP
jgi:hypothetical protein